MFEHESKASLLDKVANYTHILEKDPCSTVFIPLVEAYRRLGLLGDAEQVCIKGMIALPSFSPGFTAFGRVLTEKGELDEAIASFDKALAMDPQSIVAMKGLARVRILKDQKDEACELLQRLLSQDPSDGYATELLTTLKPPPENRSFDTEPDSPASETESFTPEPESPARDVELSEVESEPSEVDAQAIVPVEEQPEFEPSPVPTPEPVLASEEFVGRGEEASSRESDQPISTATIAEIYVKQGFLQKALDVYRDLLVPDSDNAGIHGRIEEINNLIASEHIDFSEEEEAAAGGSEDAESLSYISVLYQWLDAVELRRRHVS